MKKGIYQTLITRALSDELHKLEQNLILRKKDVDSEEVADRISLHLSKVIKSAINSIDKENSIDKNNRVTQSGEISKKIIEFITKEVEKNSIEEEIPILPLKLLDSIVGQKPDGSAETIPQPQTNLLDTTLLTNARQEPRIGRQIASEIPSSDSIDIIMAFIRKSGISPLIEDLKKHCESGRSLRILTTIYTGSTETEALDILLKIGAKIKVSYDVSGIRLHAKAWLFKRNSNFSTAYIGSSNLTYSAQVEGLEWNVRFSGVRNPDVIEKVDAVFESYWNNGDFLDYDRDYFIKLKEEKSSHSFSSNYNYLSPLEIRLEPFQEKLLEDIEVSRLQGYHKNLLVSATGTGKTVMAAIDYVRLKDKLKRSRLLFVAHRIEILEQSLKTFRQALKDHTFGEIWGGNKRPEIFKNIFASVQSLNANGIEKFDKDDFDIIIIDEFHHACANSYQKVLEYFKPIEFLGLTATPERSDGLSILEYFDGRIAAELRIWDAIDRSRLVPFIYYGIYDGQDLSKIPFSRGKGYEIQALSNVYSGNDLWIGAVIKQIKEKIGDIRNIRALGFCVSIDHAKYMAKIFNEQGLSSLAVWSGTNPTDREQALQSLKKKEINFLFSVDLFNEGVDIPEIDSLLMLRPTQSATLFLQQLGRGLRKIEGKKNCTVLDFVSKQHKDFRFDLKFRALLPGTKKDFEDSIKNKFPYLPAGCHMELDRIASEIILENIKTSLPNQWKEKILELKNIISSGHEINIINFLKFTDLEIEDIYSGGHSWTELCRSAGLAIDKNNSHEDSLLRAVSRLLHIDDFERINTYQKLLQSEEMPIAKNLTKIELNYLRMLIFSLVSKILDDKNADDRLKKGVEIVWSNSSVKSELILLLEYLKSKISHITKPFNIQNDIPLKIHARYSRIEIFAAYNKTFSWREGVLWITEYQTDLLLFTLNKTKNFSPTTRYKDYAVNKNLIHWQSQSTTKSSSPAGLRYQNHIKSGSDILLFCRTSNDDRSFYFLGPADYVSHESDMPMSIIWKLHHSLSGDLYTDFAAAVA
jgi:superfamily II DNA or RNA helicase/HKD family nuclease